MSATYETAGSKVGVSTAAPPGERRRHVRYSFTATALALELKSDTRIEARTSHLSSAGCYLDTMVPFPVGSRVQLRISHDGRAFECEARVAFSQVGMGMGLAFVKFLPEHYKILQE